MTWAWLATKADDLRLVPRTHRAEEENEPLEIILSLPSTHMLWHDTPTDTHIHAQQLNKYNFKFFKENYFSQNQMGSVCKVYGKRLLSPVLTAWSFGAQYTNSKGPLGIL